MSKICGISTLPGTIRNFMLGNLKYVASNGYTSYCICGTKEELQKDILGDVIPIQIEEMKWGLMSPLAFTKCVFRLYRIFKDEQFDIIQYATFNAAICSSIAGWMARIPVRINLQWGISYPIFKGFKRLFYYLATKVICFFSTSVQPDSKTNLKFSIDNKLYPEHKGMVIYNGSACGVDLNVYDINRRNVWSARVHDNYRLNPYKLVFGFVGRVVVEKGINELLQAFINLNEDDTCLLVVGPLDRTESLNQELLCEAKSRSNILFIGPVTNPACYYAAMDFLVLPSYQEGFGMTVLEAAGVGTPAIVSNIKGPTDLIKDGQNGLVCEPHSVESLLSSLRKAHDMTKQEYQSMSILAHDVALRDFDSDTFKKEFLANRNYLLSISNNR